MMAKIFGGIMPTLEKALDIRSARNEVIAANIANQDTPGFKAKEIDFKDALQSSIGQGQSIRMTVTEPGHLSMTGSPMDAAVTTKNSAALKGLARLDGNTVNADQEMARLSENTLMYQATVQFVSLHFNKLRDAIRGGS